MGYVRICGIYAVYCIPTGFMYVGQSVSIRDRFNHHIQELRSHRHDNRNLQAAWNCYGESNFRLDLLELVDDRSRLTEREQFWMDQFRDHLFNIAPVAGSNLGVAYTSEAKMRISWAKRGRTPWAGRHHREESKLKIRIAHLGTHLSPETREKIGAAHRGKRRKPETIEKMRKRMIGNRYWEGAVDRWSVERSKKFQFISPTGELVEVDQLKPFCLEHGLDRSAMNGVYTGRRPHHKGWTRPRSVMEER